MRFENHPVFNKLGTSLLFAGVLGLASYCGPSTANAEEELIGSAEYEYSCLSCHGVGGRGDGPMAEYLTVKPSDLTAISKNNDGVFPLLDVFMVIDGRTTVGPHGVRQTEGWEMPVWGARYQKEIGDTYGPYGAEQVIRARILELVFYIQSIQQN